MTPGSRRVLNIESNNFNADDVASCGGVRLSPLCTYVTNWPIVPAPDDGAVGGMRIGRRNRSTRRKPAAMPLCPPQNPHDVTWTVKTGPPWWEAGN
jgi:hypothetical protein